MFNSKKDPTLPILKKRPDKLNAIEVMEYFGQGRKPSSQQLISDYNNYGSTTTNAQESVRILLMMKNIDQQQLGQTQSICSVYQ